MTITNDQLTALSNQEVANLSAEGNRAQTIETYGHYGLMNIQNENKKRTTQEVQDPITGKKATIPAGSLDTPKLNQFIDKAKNKLRGIKPTT